MCIVLQILRYLNEVPDLFDNTDRSENSCVSPSSLRRCLPSNQNNKTNQHYKSIWKRLLMYWSNKAHLVYSKICNLLLEKWRIIHFYLKSMTHSFKYMSYLWIIHEAKWKHTIPKHHPRRVNCKILSIKFIHLFVRIHICLKCYNFQMSSARVFFEADWSQKNFYWKLWICKNLI